MSYSKPVNHDSILAKMYFNLDEKNAEGKVKCRKCDLYCKDNSGHGNLASHVKNKHSCWKDELADHFKSAAYRGEGSMDTYVTITRVVSDEAKNMSSWIEWIVFADLPITIVENEYYRKNSKLKPTSYKTISKHMTNLLEIVRASIKTGLPKTFGLIFDGILQFNLMISLF